MRFVTLFSPPLTSTYNDNVLQSLSCDTRAEAQDATTGDENLDVLLLTHLRLCQGLLQVHSSLGAPRALPAIVDPDLVFGLFDNSRETQNGNWVH